MTIIDLTREQPSVDDLLRLAARDPVRIRSQNGEEFILESADAFDREVAELSRSEKFMSFLAERAREPGRTRLEDIERRLIQTEQAVEDRPGFARGQ
jgi:PHD/YefM family antitoxin component YafN of YafNO toxin-antitoxin module